jgi:hypothetical protein
LVASIVCAERDFALGPDVFFFRIVGRTKRRTAAIRKNGRNRWMFGGRS